MSAERVAKLAAVTWLVIVTGSHAADGDPEAGRRKTVTCNGCHGQASMQSVPNLGGQSPTYFIAAMRAYQEGKRAHATMRDVAKAYSDRELKNFAAYYAQLGKQESQRDAAIEKPAASAQCEACHGALGRTPVNPESAVLAGQKAAYLKLALKEYREGTRKHAVMQQAAANLTDPDIEVLAAYFSQLNGLLVK